MMMTPPWMITEPQTAHRDAGKFQAPLRGQVKTSAAHTYVKRSCIDCRKVISANKKRCLACAEKGTF